MPPRRQLRTSRLFWMSSVLSPIAVWCAIGVSLLERGLDALSSPRPLWRRRGLRRGEVQCRSAPWRRRRLNASSPAGSGARVRAYGTRMGCRHLFKRAEFVLLFALAARAPHASPSGWADVCFRAIGRLSRPPAHIAPIDSHGGFGVRPYLLRAIWVIWSRSEVSGYEAFCQAARQQVTSLPGGSDLRTTSQGVISAGRRVSDCRYWRIIGIRIAFITGRTPFISARRAHESPPCLGWLCSCPVAPSHGCNRLAGVCLAGACARRP